MYSRYAASREGQPPGVRLPPNYSGNAFSVQPPAPPNGGSPAPLDFSGLPRVSDLPRASTQPHREPLIAEPVHPEPPGEMPAAGARDTPGNLLPSSQDASGDGHGNDRPLLSGLFGTGLPGREEIILLGLCLLLMYESTDADCDRGDLTETLLLLGALFLWGS